MKYIYGFIISLSLICFMAHAALSAEQWPSDLDSSPNGATKVEKEYPASTLAPAANGMKRVSYANFTMDYPASWQVRQDAQPPIFFTAMLPTSSSSFQSNIVLTTDDLTSFGQISSEQYANFTLSQLQSQLPGFNLMSKETISIGGKNASRLIFSSTINGIQLTQMQIYMISGKTGIIATVSSESSSAQKVFSEAGKALNTIKF